MKKMVDLANDCEMKRRSSAGFSSGYRTFIPDTPTKSDVVLETGGATVHTRSLRGTTE